MSRHTRLQNEWNQLYREALPAAAKRQDKTQAVWPVWLDHCFARIILDHVIGQDQTPWTKKLESPAVKNMTEDQLKNCIAFGKELLSGSADLVHLDQISLASRGTGEEKYKKRVKRPAEEYPSSDPANKTRRDRGHVDAAQSGKRRRGNVRSNEVGQAKLSFGSPSSKTTLSLQSPREHDPASAKEHEQSLLKIQNHPTMTPYRKRLFRTLLSVPTGSWTTYGALATFLNSKARPVGNGLRNNPFAPDVPCHRVLAGDGSIGGFAGEWGKDGKHAPKKLKLLKDEGVKFDGNGKVKGIPFTNFKDLGAP